MRPKAESMAMGVSLFAMGSSATASSSQREKRVTATCEVPLA